MRMLLATVTLLMSVVIPFAALAQQSPDRFARMVVLKPKPDHATEFTAGYKRHIAWHAEHADPWTWYGWTFVLGDRIGQFMDGTFGHALGDFDHPLDPRGDSADNAANVMPHADFVSHGVYERLDAASSGEPLPDDAPYLSLVTYSVVPGQEQRFEETIAQAAKHRGDVRVSWYRLQAGGALNAFAMRFMGRGYVVLFSDVVELARRQGEQALAFVIAHELAHHERGHTGWKRLVIAPALWIPFIGSAYSRACEYTCDAYATDAVADGAVDGLLVLAAGKELYAEVDADAFVLQAQEERGFWVRFAEMMSTHPTLPKRVRAVRNRFARMPERAGATEAGLLPV